MDFPSQRQLYLGTAAGYYLGYSNDTTIREHAASGGIVSQLITSLLKTKKIDGAVLCRSRMLDKKISYEVKIVTDPDEVLNFSSSVYFDIPLLKYLPVMKQFNGRLAVVGLPCHVHALRNFIARDPVLSEKIVVIIGLFCGHNSRKELILDVLCKKGINESEIHHLVFRRGHWRGNMEVFLHSGSKVSFPFQDFSIYQNLFCDTLIKCLHCHDHTAELADISCGDAWLPFLKKDPVKHSVIITRNDTADTFLHDLRRKGDLFLMQIEPEIVFESQRRSIIFHKSIEARSKVGRFFGYAIKCPKHYSIRARWNDYLSAFMILLVVKGCSSKAGRRLFLIIPRIFLYPWLYAFKFLTNF